MEPDRHEYRGRVIELRPREGPAAEARRGEGAVEPEVELLIDEQPMSYGQLPDGTYFLHEYAYDWQGDLAELAHRFIDYQDRTQKRPGG